MNKEKSKLDIILDNLKDNKKEEAKLLTDLILYIKQQQDGLSIKEFDIFSENRDK